MPNWRTPRGTQLRHCAKVALAAVVAYALTFGGRNDYALFSAMGAALVVGGSVGEDLKTSLNRVRGTVAGALVGAAFATVLGKTIWSLGIAVGVMAWLSIGLGWGVAAMRVGIPMTLVILFTHEADAAHYGVWRVLNTLMGVACWHCDKPLRMADSCAGRSSSRNRPRAVRDDGRARCAGQRHVVRRIAAAAAAVARYAYRDKNGQDQRQSGAPGD